MPPEGEHHGDLVDELALGERGAAAATVTCAEQDREHVVAVGAGTPCGGDSRARDAMDGAHAVPHAAVVADGQPVRDRDPEPHAAAEARERGDHACADTLGVGGGERMPCDRPARGREHHRERVAVEAAHLAFVPRRERALGCVDHGRRLALGVAALKCGRRDAPASYPTLAVEGVERVAEHEPAHDGQDTRLPVAGGVGHEDALDLFRAAHEHHAPRPEPDRRDGSVRTRDRRHESERVAAKRGGVAENRQTRRAGWMKQGVHARSDPARGRT